MHGSGYMVPCIEGQQFGVHQGYLCEARGMRKELHRAAFQGMHEQSVELYEDQVCRAIQSKRQILVRMCHSKLLGIYVFMELEQIFLN